MVLKVLKLCFGSEIFQYLAKQVVVSVDPPSALRVAPVKHCDLSSALLNRSAVIPVTPPHLRKALRSSVFHQSSVISRGGRHSRDTIAASTLRLGLDIVAISPMLSEIVVGLIPMCT